MAHSSPMEIIDLTADGKVMIDLTGDDVIDLTEDTDMVDESFFTIFLDLPIELRLKVWEHAFPQRVVNLTYDQYNDRFHSYNTTPPLLLKIHRESRELALRQYTLCFGTDSYEPRIYFDFTKDILLFDDYLDYGQPANSHSKHYINQLEYQDYPIADEERDQIQRVAVNWSAFFRPNLMHQGMNDDQWNKMTLQQIIQPLVVRFSSLRELSFLIEEVNPFPRAPIRLFKLGSNRCSPICDVCYHTASCQVPIKHLRTVFGQKLKIRLLGAFRGSSRFDLGCYESLVERTADDDTWEYGLEFESSDDFEDPFSTECVVGEIEEYQEEREIYLKKDVYEEDFEYDTEEELLVGDNDKDALPVISEGLDEGEVDWLEKDEENYQACIKIGMEYTDMQGEWVPPDYFLVRDLMTPL